MTFKELRQQLGFSRKQIEKRCGLKDSAVSKWEHGKAKPRLDIVIKLSSILGVSIEEVVNCFDKQNDA